jgi:hypothetical protein
MKKNQHTPQRRKMKGAKLRWLLFLLLFITVGAVNAQSCSCSGNLLSGSSFESSTDLSFWTVSTNEPGGSFFSVDVPYAVCGSQYGYIRAADNSHNPAYLVQIYQNVSATAGMLYTLNAYAGSHDPSQDMQVKLEFYNASNVLLSGGQTVQVDANVDVAAHTELVGFSLR